MSRRTRLSGRRKLVSEQGLGDRDLEGPGDNRDGQGDNCVGPGDNRDGPGDNRGEVSRVFRMAGDKPGPSGSLPLCWSQALVT